jgi:hypothetical protein
MSTTKTRSNLTEVEVAAGRARGEARMLAEPYAERAEYDADAKRLVISLRGGALVAIPVSAIEEIADAKPAELALIKAGRFGDVIELRERDVDISLVGLLRDLSGKPATSVAAAAMGKRGGAAMTEAKAEAARANGAKGGRPRRATANAPVSGEYDIVKHRRGQGEITVVKDAPMPPSGRITMGTHIQLPKRAKR